MAAPVVPVILPALDIVERVLVNIGLRPTRVLLHTRVWLSGTVGEGANQKRTLELLPVPHVEEMDGTGLVKVGPITPKYAGNGGGGYAIHDLAPATKPGVEYYYELRGPRGAYVYSIQDMDTAHALGYYLRLVVLNRPGFYLDV